MNTLWIFGDSFSTPFDHKTTFQWAKPYCEWKGYTPKIYSQIIATELGLKLSSHAIGGLDNYSILEKVCENTQNIKQNDIVIIVWTMINRFRIVNDLGKDVSIIGNYHKEQSKGLKFISSNTLEEISINRDMHKSIFEYELYQWTQLINSALNCKIIYYNLNSSKEYQTINEETKGNILDGHYSEIGHIEFAKDLLSLINNNDRINYLGNFTKTKLKLF